MKPIEMLLYTWCRDKREKDRSYLVWLCGAAVVICGGLLAYFLFSLNMLVLFASLIFGGILCGEGNRLTPPTPAQLRDRGSKVPDDFLEIIADSERVPKWVKSKIFEIISTKGTILFRELADLDSDIESESEENSARDGAGYKKLAAFAVQKESDGLAL